MQIDEDDSDHNLEAITERERKPSRVPLCPATPRKPYEKFSRLHCFLVSPWSHGGADQLRHTACLPATVKITGHIHTLFGRGASLLVAG